MTDAAQEALPEVTDSGTVLVSGLPFTFAQSRNVLLDRTASAPRFFVPPLLPEVLLEVRRYVGEVFALELLSDDVFRQRLTLAYQRTQNEAAQMAEICHQTLIYPPR